MATESSGDEDAYAECAPNELTSDSSYHFAKPSARAQQDKRGGYSRDEDKDGNRKGIRLGWPEYCKKHMAKIQD
eukprot:1103370-Pleurochrysis_carterae.AAC.1